MSEWQDISTAPKDGRSVLLFREGEMWIAKWLHGEVHGPCWVTPDGFVIFRSTHWHPVPDPPQ